MRVVICDFSGRRRSASTDSLHLTPVQVQLEAAVLGDDSGKTSTLDRIGHTLISHTHKSLYYYYPERLKRKSARTQWPLF